MISAIDIIGGVVAGADRYLMQLKNSSKSILTYIHGSAKYIENEIMVMGQGKRTPYPAVALFTEGVVETADGVFTNITIPKLVIAIPTKNPSASTGYKHEESFRKGLYEIMDAMEKELKMVHFGYDLQVSKTDVTSYSNKIGSVGLNDICDGIIIKNLKLKILNKNNC